MHICDPDLKIDRAVCVCGGWGGVDLTSTMVECLNVCREL